MSDCCPSVKYYSQEEQKLTEVIPGASMWAISLEKTQLTYFEVEPESEFELHQHPSEQITYVLEGSLFFGFGEKQIEVKSGEVIAIPSNLPHAVHTKSKSAKAIDSWSPINKKYSE
jgi:quercetin dioxygenase-like cupin family protein